MWWRCTPMPRWNSSEPLPEPPIPASAFYLVPPCSPCKYVFAPCLSNKLSVLSLYQVSVMASLTPAQVMAPRCYLCSGAKHVLGTGCSGEPRPVLCCPQGGPSQGGWQIEITRGSSVQREAPSGVL